MKDGLIIKNVPGTGGGGGSSVSVNGTSVSNPNFNDSTPAAPAGKVNAAWQFDGSGNVSANVDAPLLHYRRTNLTPTDVLNLVGTPVEVIPTPGAGFMIYPVKISILANTTGNNRYQLQIPDNPPGAIVLRWGSTEWGYTSSVEATCDPIVIEEPDDAIAFFLQTGNPSIESVVGKVVNMDNQPLNIKKLGSYNASAGPILTAQVNSGNGGSGYAVDDQFAIASNNQQAGGQVTSVDGSGAVLTFDLVDIGSGVGGGNYVPVTGTDTVVLSGGGDGALLVDILTIQQGDAPVAVQAWYLIVPTA